MYVYIHMCVYIHIYAYTLYIHYMCLCICMCLYMYVYTYIHIYVPMYLSIYIHPETQKNLFLIDNDHFLKTGPPKSIPFYLFKQNLIKCHLRGLNGVMTMFNRQIFKLEFLPKLNTSCLTHFSFVFVYPNEHTKIKRS